MTNYRRNFAPGGCQFFTVNLAERKSRLLTDHVDFLRAAFRYARARYPFTVDALARNGHAAALPSPAMNSRLFITRSPRRRARAAWMAT
jgi:hypothetical protein